MMVLGRIMLGLGVMAGVAYAWLGTGSDALLTAGTPAAIALKMAGVGCLALYAALSGRRTIALVLALGALGDGLIEWNLTAGAIAFLAGHLVAIRFYWPSRPEAAILAMLKNKD